MQDMQAATNYSLRTTGCMPVTLLAQDNWPYASHIIYPGQVAVRQSNCFHVLLELKLKVTVELYVDHGWC